LHKIIKMILKNTICCLSLFSLLSIAGCKDKEPDVETPPTIIVTGQNPFKTGIYLTFVDDSVRISGRFGIDSVWMEHNIDTSLLGYYQITYHAVSFSGMTAEAQRDVWVVVMPNQQNKT